MALSLDRPVPLTKLDAVNLVLRARGHEPTAQLGEGARATAQEAEEALAAALLETLQEEWSFNKEDELRLQPDPAGNVYLPENLVSFEVTGPSEGLNVSARGNRLFDRDGGTFRFSGTVHLSAALALPFEDLPQPARWYITKKAAFDYGNQAVPGDPSLRPSLEEVQRARVLLDRFDNKLRRRNMRTGNPHFKRLRGDR